MQKFGDECQIEATAIRSGERWVWFVVFVCGRSAEPGQVVNAAADLRRKGKEREGAFALEVAIVVVGVDTLLLIRWKAIVRDRKSVGKIQFP